MKVFNFKKAAFAIIIAAATIISASAQQKGDFAFGANAALGSGDQLTNYGIGVKLQYNFTDPLRAEASFTYFLKEKEITMWDASSNLHYLFPVGDKFTVYPLAGLCILNISVDASDLGYGDISASESRFGFGLGGGADYKISDKLLLNAEIKYKIVSDMNRLMVSVGFSYIF